jgi:peptidoglycan/xylan/chitin deacetylase (PgdA/CDA1 family)
VESAQWGLGAYERFLSGDGERWLAAATAVGEHLLSIQQPDGAWLHHVDMPHTYELRPPWISAMAQGEGASLLVRLHRETGEERWSDGGASALLDGSPFPEEYPTEPPSFVLNGGIFALWGFHDVGVGLGDERAASDFADGVDTLARNIRRWDTGYWSLYDLFPHPIRNIASSAYHQIHIAQLRATNMLAPRRELAAAADRWEGYARERFGPRRAFAEKSAFRLAVPRNRSLAHRLPWSHARRSRPGKRFEDPLVLCYHAVSPTWPSTLAVAPDQLREQLTALVRRGYRGVTFAEIAGGEARGRVMAVTFDDGYRSVLERGLPVLGELGLPATIFVPTAWVGSDRPMSWPGVEQWSGGQHADELLCLGWDGLRELQAAGWEVGSHTVSHPRLPEVADDAELDRELTESKAACEREMGRPCETLAYPYGAHDARVEAAAERAGYRAAAILAPGRVSRYRWPRVGVYPVDRRARFGVKVARPTRALRARRG